MKWILISGGIILFFMWWFRSPFKPYDTMPFSIEPFVAYDSIVATYGTNGLGQTAIERYYLITGFVDTLACEHKIDSLLPSLVDTFYDIKHGSYIYFFKKSNKCNNDYTRGNREWTENFADAECLFVRYDIRIRRPQYDFIIVNKKKVWTSPNGYSEYLLRWYGNSALSETEDRTINKIPESERNIPLENIFEKLINEVKSNGLFQQKPHTKEIREYDLH